MAGREVYPASAGPVPSGCHPRSFAARAFVRANTDPSEDSLGPRNRYRDGMTIRAVTPEPELEYDAEEEDESAATPALTHVTTTTTTTPPRTPSRSTIRSASSRWEMLGRSSPEPPPPSSPDKARNIKNRASSVLPPAAQTQFAEMAISRTKSQSPTDRMRRPPAVATSPQSDDIFAIRRRFAPPVDAVSVGYPSTQALPNLSQVSSSSSSTRSQSNKPVKHRLLRSQTSINTLNSQTFKESDRQPSSPINADFDTLVQLMKQLCGRMESYVDFRVGSSLTWTKGYCSIDANTGSLMHQADENPASGPPTVIVPDLRGCQVRTSAEDSDGIIDLLTHSSKISMKLRPLGEQHYFYWLAALLCWRPIRPAGAQNKMVKSQTPILSRDKRRRNSDAKNRGDVSIIKVGRMLLWRPEKPTMPVPNPKSSKNARRAHAIAWQSVSCTLQDTGEFRLHREMDSSLQYVVQLSQLSRCAVQQLDPSILDQEFCIAIYPQYTPMETSSSARPLYLGIETRELFEVWFVLLKAFTRPEIYGPANMGNSSLGSISSEPVADQKSSGSLADSYRIQRSLFLRIVEAKINYSNRDSDRESMDCYSEVLLDGEVRAKTMVRTKTHNPFWREDYEFPDLPTILSDAAIVLKQRDPRWKSKGSGSVTAGSGGFGGGLGGTSLPGSKDTVIGRVEIQLEELLFGGGKNEIEGWMPLVANYKEGIEERVGEMYVKAEMEELTVLMSAEYTKISNVLHAFESGLTLQLARVITDLKRLAETLLDIFQVNNKASDWLMALAENEIDGLHKERPPIQDKPPSGGSDGPSQADGHTRGQNGLVDANILFRGNSLLTKALDTHMKRLGREYLELTLGEHLQKIARDDTYCEVDPMKIDNSEHLQKNWRILLQLTKTIWRAVYQSAERCPLELRKILRHIRSRVEDRYGDLFKTVSYSSVCGFLFLRFFCPAILNPKLFGLLKDHPGVRAQRTLTLITKSLQVLANMTAFGVKEPWMSPMNQFIGEHKAELKNFVDSVTTLSPDLDKAPRCPPPSYATPQTILNRLSGPSKEGFPSLPHLIDQPRAFSALVAMWHKFYPIHVSSTAVLPPSNLPPLTPELHEFDDLCRGIRCRISECTDRAENAERPGSSTSLSARWEEVAEKATGVAASSGVYAQAPGGGNRMQRVNQNSSCGGITTISSDASSTVWATTVSASDLGPMGYSASVVSTGNQKSKLSGFVGGFKGLQRKLRSDHV